MEFGIQWPLVLFSLCAGVGAITFASAALVDLAGKASERTSLLSSVVGLALMIVGGCFSLLHLALPQNVMAAVTNIFSFSGISVELILLGITVILAIVYAILWKKNRSDSSRRVVAVLGIVSAALLAFFCGHGYVMSGRPLWDSELLPLAYLGTSLGGGAFLYAALAFSLDRENGIGAVGRAWLLVAAILATATVILYVVFVGCNDALTQEAFAMGVGAVVTAIGVLACGIILFPQNEQRAHLPVSIVGCACAIASGLLIRTLMWAVCAGYLELFNVAMNGRVLFF